ncbi:MAG: Gfo/Idh/MocA family protein [Enterocloster sp.]
MSRICKDKIRFATIGTNFIVDWFLEAAAVCDGLQHQAVYSRNEEKGRAFAEKYGVSRVYTSLEELAESKEIDAVYIASPNSLHFGQAARMLKAGKHVLCEKTITSNPRELRVLLELAKEHQVTILEAMRSAFDPGFQTIRENLGRLGKIRRVTFQYGKYSSRYDHFKEGIIENAFNPALSNGALTDIGVYCVHPLVKLFGMPKRVIADGIFLENGVDAAGTVLADYDGMQAELLYSKISDNRLPSQIQGEEGTMLIKEIPNPYQVTLIDRKGREEVLISRENERNLIYEAQEWARVINGESDAGLHNRFSVMELEVMEEVKKQLGICFPADKEDIL